jgi:hypothetical protein
MCQFAHTFVWKKLRLLVSFRLFSAIGTSSFLLVTLLAFRLLKHYLEEFVFLWEVWVMLRLVDNVFGNRLIAGVLGFTV